MEPVVVETLGSMLEFPSAGGEIVQDLSVAHVRFVIITV